MWQLMSWSEYKRLAVEEAFEQGAKITAKRIGVSKSTMYRWIKERYPHLIVKGNQHSCTRTHLPTRLLVPMTTTKTTTNSRSH